MTGPAAPSYAFTYTVLQLVPCLQRGERINVGVALHSRQHGFVGIKSAVPADRLKAVAPDFDPEPARAALAAITRVIEGQPEGGRLAALPASERFGWLVAPSSTSIQAAGTHTGVTADPATELERLFHRLVL